MKRKLSIILVILLLVMSVASYYPLDAFGLDQGGNKVSEADITGGKKDGYLAKSNWEAEAASQHPTEPGEVKYFKTARPVEGMVNTWDMNLRVEAKDPEKETTDIVLVIDTSGSMKFENRMENAKTAAKSFVAEFLPSDNVKIGLVAYESKVHNEKPLTDDAEDLNRTINKLKANGGTFTQAGLKHARDMLAASKADNKYIVLLSDGEPTYSYAIKDGINDEQWDYFEGEYDYEWGVRKGRGFENKSSFSEDQYDYLKRAGNGFRIRTYYDTKWKKDYYYNHGNSAIAEAGFAGNAGYELYTVGLGLGKNSVGAGVLEKMAAKAGRPENFNNSNGSDLKDIFTDIAKDIQSSVRNLKVVDPMGQGFSLVDGSVRTEDGDTQIDGSTIRWNAKGLAKPIAENSDVRYAELDYRIEINDDIVALMDRPENKEGCLTNGLTSIAYRDHLNKQVNSEFQVPRVKPLVYKIEKEVFDKNGNKKSKDRDFEIGLKSLKNIKGKFHEIFSLNPKDSKAETGYRTDLRYIDSYKVWENLPEEYKVKYFVDGQEKDEFIIDRDSSGKIDIRVENKEKPAKLIIKKNFEKSDLVAEPEFKFLVEGPDGYEKGFSLPDEGSWQKEIGDLAQGNYKVTELTKGYKTSVRLDDEEFVKGDQLELELKDGFIVRTVEIKNEYNKADLRLIKKNSRNDEPLKKAEFTLYMSDDKWQEGQELKVLESGEDGLLEFKGLIPGKYILRESKSPFGFTRPSGFWKLEVKMDGSISLRTEEGQELEKIKDAYVIYNSPGISLPATGGPGREIFYLVGLVYIYILFKVRSRRKL